MPASVERLLLSLDLVNACRVDFGRLAEREWLGENDAPRRVSLKPVIRQLARSHLDARLAAAMASDAFE